MKTSFYEEDELKQLGLNSYGENVLISRLCSIYGAENISLGSNIRIDDFATITSTLNQTVIGDYFHLGLSSSIMGGNIFVGNFVTVSTKVSIFSISDDYFGNSLSVCVGIPDDFRNMYSGRVEIGDHVNIGPHSIVVPDIIISSVVSIGANSFVNKNCDSFGIYAGTPAKRIKEKSKRCLELEQSFRGLSND